MIAVLRLILAWLGRLGPWLRGLLPAVAVMASGVAKAWGAIRMPFRVALVVAVAAVIPLPAFIEDLPGRVQTLPNTVRYFFGVLELQFGVSVIMAAWIFRWLWRVLAK